MHRTILYFGSFNPVHKGHTAIARYLIDNGCGGEVWFMVSPESPFKRNGSLIAEDKRLAMVEIAIREDGYPGRMKACDMEFSMPRPSYTIDTVRRIRETYPERQTAVLIGSDNVDDLDKWKDHEELLEICQIFAYPRDNYSPTKFRDRITLLKNAPLWDHSSTQVREALRSGGDAHGMVSPGVCEYIKKNGLWT